MKLIIVIIKFERFDVVKKEFYKVEVNFIIVSEVFGYGRQMGVIEVYCGVKEMGNFLRKICLEIVVNESYVELIIDVILKGVQIGQIGDGKIFIFDFVECIWIRIEERGGGVIG